MFKTEAGPPETLPLRTPDHWVGIPSPRSLLPSALGQGVGGEPRAYLKHANTVTSAGKLCGVRAFILFAVSSFHNLVCVLLSQHIAIWILNLHRKYLICI